MSVPESIAWLETSQDSSSPSAARIYAKTILDELQRLSGTLEDAVRELDKREELRQNALSELRALDSSFHSLEEKAKLARDEWDASRVTLEGQLARSNESLAVAEGMLKDVHYALLKQPELKREEIAGSITSVVTPYTEGERP